MIQHERITCDDVQVGDSISRTRGGQFETVVAINEGPVSRRLCFTQPEPGARRSWGRNIRPGREAKLWRIATVPTNLVATKETIARHMPAKSTKRSSSTMAVTTKTNSTKRKAAARKAGKCQLCGTKTKGHSVTINYDTGKVSKSAAGRAKEGYAFYCTECADKKVKRLIWKLARRAAGGTKKAAKRTTKAAAKPKAARKAAVKPKRATKAKAATKAKRTAAKAPAKPSKAERKAKREAREAKAAKPKRARKPAAAATTSEDPF